MKQNTTMMTVIAMVVVGIVAFYAGIKYDQNKTPQFGNGQFRNNTGMMERNGRQLSQGGFRPTSGDIISRDDKSITVKMMDGSSKIVFLSDKTEVFKADKATGDDLTTGQRVAVFGTDNPDGSVTASNIQLNPQFGGGMRDRNNPSIQPQQ